MSTSEVRMSVTAHQVTASDVSCVVSEWSLNGGEGICGGTIKIHIGDQVVEMFTATRDDLYDIMRSLANPTLDGWDTGLKGHYTPTGLISRDEVLV